MRGPAACARFTILPPQAPATRRVSSANVVGQRLRRGPAVAGEAPNRHPVPASDTTNSRQATKAKAGKIMSFHEHIVARNQLGNLVSTRAGFTTLTTEDANR